MASSNRTEFAVLGLLALGARTGYDIKKMADEALGHFWNESFGHIYPILRRLEARGWVTSAVEPQEGRPDRKVYALTPAGQRRVAAWLAEVSWPKPDLAEFHLKLVAAAAARLADPVELVAAQRRELLRRLHEVQQAVLAEPADSAGVLLLEGVVLRLQADLRWLAACERAWSETDDESEGV